MTITRWFYTKDTTTRQVFTEETTIFLLHTGKEGG